MTLESPAVNAWPELGRSAAVAVAVGANEFLSRALQLIAKLLRLREWGTTDLDRLDGRPEPLSNCASVLIVEAVRAQPIRGRIVRGRKISQT